MCGGHLMADDKDLNPLIIAGFSLASRTTRKALDQTASEPTERESAMIRNLPRRPLAAAAVVAGGLGAMAAAPPAPADQPALEHCVLDLDTGCQTCYGEFSAAFAAASDGQITDAPDNPKAASQDSGLQGLREETLRLMSDSGASSRVVVGTFFKDKNYGGGSLTLFGPEPGKDDQDWVAS